jgi:DNA-binding response OmpR family regulator
MGTTPSATDSRARNDDPDTAEEPRLDEPPVDEPPAGDYPAGDRPADEVTAEGSAPSEAVGSGTVPPSGPAPKSRLLLVEDDMAVREAVSIAFEGLGFTVLALVTGETLEQAVEEFRPDIAILDVMLPAGPDGFELARRIVTMSGIPVIFLTAADALEDRLSGFDAGGDDYVVKPFAMAELLARVRALLRRSGRLDSPVIEIRDLLIDDSTKQAFRSGTSLELTPTEFELLSVLARSPSEVYSKGQLLSQVWGFDAYDPNLVEVHMSALRRKLEANGPRLVHTVRGRGYVFRV